jgi:hypothetical protein
MSPFPLQPDPYDSPDLLSPRNWPDGIVWHYTNAAGLAGIIRENVLWASSTGFMNDRHEMRTGAELLRRLLNQHKDYLEPRVRLDVQSMVKHATAQDRYRTFVSCACKDANNLTMWRNYTGPEVGFAIGLDTTRPLRMRRQKAMTDEMIGQLGFLDDDSKLEVINNARRDLGSFAWRAAVYNPEEQVQVAWGRLRELETAALARSQGQQPERYELDVMADIYDELQTFKHYGFEDEREMRVVCWAGLHTDLIYVKHRPSPYGVVPYVELCLPENSDSNPVEGPEAVQELPILGIAVGPTPYPEEAATGVNELLRAAGRNSIAVIPSKVPFRR